MPKWIMLLWLVSGVKVGFIFLLVSLRSRKRFSPVRVIGVAILFAAIGGWIPMALLEFEITTGSFIGSWLAASVAAVLALGVYARIGSYNLRQL